MTRCGKNQGSGCHQYYHSTLHAMDRRKMSKIKPNRSSTWWSLVAALTMSQRKTIAGGVSPRTFWNTWTLWTWASSQQQPYKLEIGASTSTCLPGWLNETQRETKTHLLRSHSHNEVTVCPRLSRLYLYSQLNFRSQDTLWRPSHLSTPSPPRVFAPPEQHL